MYSNVCQMKIRECIVFDVFLYQCCLIALFVLRNSCCLLTLRRIWTYGMVSYKQRLFTVQILMTGVFIIINLHFIWARAFSQAYF